MQNHRHGSFVNCLPLHKWYFSRDSGRLLEILFASFVRCASHTFFLFYLNHFLSPKTPLEPIYFSLPIRARDKILNFKKFRLIRWKMSVSLSFSLFHSKISTYCMAKSIKSTMLTRKSNTKKEHTNTKKRKK